MQPMLGGKPIQMGGTAAFAHGKGGQLVQLATGKGGQTVGLIRTPQGINLVSQPLSHAAGTWHFISLSIRTIVNSVLFIEKYFSQYHIF